MSITNSERNGCKDVFHAFLVKNAIYESYLEIPCLKLETSKPKQLISFSKAVGGNQVDSWIHFYEDDVAFERIWNNPKKYLPILKRFSGVITLDFSIYRDMPLVMQYWNVYRSRAIGHWLQENGISVIPNVRFGDDRTFNVACAGIKEHTTIAIGSHGCLKRVVDREFFVNGLKFIINELQPTTIVIYGAAPDKIFSQYRDMGIEIIQFDSEFMKSRKKVSI